MRQNIYFHISKGDTYKKQSPVIKIEWKKKHGNISQFSGGDTIIDRLLSEIYLWIVFMRKIRWDRIK